MGENGIENVFHEIMGEKSSNQRRKEAQRIPNKMNPSRPTLRHIIIEMATVKEFQR